MAVIENAIDIDGLAEFLDGCDARFASKSEVPALPRTVGELPDGEEEVASE